MMQNRWTLYKVTKEFIIPSLAPVLKLLRFVNKGNHGLKCNPYFSPSCILLLELFTKYN
jgi:hypothetical protein